MTDRDEQHHPQPEPFQEPRRSFGEALIWENLPEHIRLEIIATENIDKAYAAREAAGERARATIQLYDAQIRERLEREEWERERGY